LVGRLFLRALEGRAFLAVWRRAVEEKNCFWRKLLEGGMMNLVLLFWRHCGRKRSPLEKTDI
jgi:hypothetical protein